MTTTSQAIAPGEAPAAASPLSTLALFGFVVTAWSLNWVVMKVAVQEVRPLWAVAIRTALAAVVLFPPLLATGQLRRPPRADLPVLLAISLFHMTAFAALMTMGLALVPAGRAIVLGYTTPLWVAPAAFVFIGERISARQSAGIVVGLVGLLLLFGPASLDWGNRQALLGQVLLLAAALCWSVSIVYTRAHRWVATPLQLMPWQCLLATMVLASLAVLVEGPPPDPGRTSTAALLALAYNGVIGTALGFWAMTVVNRRVPATTAALGVLATPVLGIGLSAAVLGEGFDPMLILSAFIILAGIAMGVTGRKRSA
ncbi:Permease of the drug/metabolite transporter (DMT) superfamily [Methylobacterium sp. UNC378MF]|uniref:DMT family transporter n=1 Tax=Methylobacterium sp. UNC378MF TaxID=1502748 RepID=UPI0008840702|nr:DMT family transporter [Methylobacterium sp. UNC378MF]SDA17410.1 Permease of the drug/metabolite transporter (DMT) superfamily [Methylobacterium sp. UNC378MF]